MSRARELDSMDAKMDATISTDDSGRVLVTGPVTYGTVTALLAAARPLLANRADVTIDLGGTTTIDSAGLSLLIEWLRQARAGNQALRFVDLPEKLLAIARLSGVEGLLVAGSGPGQGASASSRS